MPLFVFGVSSEIQNRHDEARGIIDRASGCRNRGDFYQRPSVCSSQNSVFYEGSGTNVYSKFLLFISGFLLFISGFLLGEKPGYEFM